MLVNSVQSDHSDSYFKVCYWAIVEFLKCLSVTLIMFTLDFSVIISLLMDSENYFIYV